MFCSLVIFYQSIFSVAEEALMDFDSLIACQSGLGTGAVIVMNQQVCLIFILVWFYIHLCSL